MVDAPIRFEVPLAKALVLIEERVCGRHGKRRVIETDRVSFAFLRGDTHRIEVCDRKTVVFVIMRQEREFFVAMLNASLEHQAIPIHHLFELSRPEHDVRELRFHGRPPSAYDTRVDRSPTDFTLDDPRELARYGGWTEDVYRDFDALSRGTLRREDFDARYLETRAVLVLDLTGFTEAARQDPLESLLRIFEARKLCIPALLGHDAAFVRAFADDLVALFARPEPALDAALEIHRRLAMQTDGARSQACIGLGYGEIYAFGANRAMGLEMNLTSRLGEDTAKGAETLLTEGAYRELASRRDVSFESLTDGSAFAYYRVTPAS